MSNQLTQDLAMIARNAIDYIIELERQRDESEKWRGRDEARAANAERERDEAEAQRDALLKGLEQIEKTTYDSMTAALARVFISKAEGEKA